MVLYQVQAIFLWEGISFNLPPYITLTESSANYAYSLALTLQFKKFMKKNVLQATLLFPSLHFSSTKFTLTGTTPLT